jgi:hypothetical protein
VHEERLGRGRAPATGGTLALGHGLAATPDRLGLLILDPNCERLREGLPAEQVHVARPV